MNDNQKLAASIVIVSAAVAVAAVQLHKYQQDIYARFPDLDRKVARKAYRRMLLKAYSGQYPDLQQYADVDMDVFFLAEVHKIQN